MKTLLLVASTAFAAMVLVSVEEEIEIGRTANEQARKQVPEFKDSTVTRYVRDVGNRLVRAAPGAKYPYSFTVADLPEITAEAQQHEIAGFTICSAVFQQLQTAQIATDGLNIRFVQICRHLDTLTLQQLVITLTRHLCGSRAGT